MKPSPTQRQDKYTSKYYQPPKQHKKFGYFFAHKSYVTPASMVKKLLDERHYMIQARVSAMTEAGKYRAEYEDEGWIELLAWEMGQILRSTPEAVLRRMYDIRYDKAKVCNISFAEALCEALGMNMEIETDIPTLPGNRKLAAELVSIRAEMAGVELSDEELRVLADRAWRLSAIIVRNPERMERVQNMAPFDCLRSPR